MSNSSLVNYTKISPNRSSPRNHKIDTITIHCVVGQCSVETLGQIFAPRSKQASSNYGIGPDGRIGMYVEEKDRSWCSSNGANDNRAVTIEVASDTTDPYKVTDAAYNSLIKLCADICKRNGIKELKWKADKSLIGQVDKQNMTVHRWFANKSCPGDYLYKRHGDIAKKVNKILNDKKEDTNKETKKETKKEDTNKDVKDDSFIVSTKIDYLRIRKGPGTNYAWTGKYAKRGAYTIVKTKKGTGSKKGWGKLKSGAGWISLDYTTKV